MTTVSECPVCGAPLFEHSWQEDCAGVEVTVESLAKCDCCSYEAHDSYGTTTVTVGNREWAWRHSTPEAEIEKAIEQEKETAKR